jgi:hypothetical protein
MTDEVGSRKSSLHPPTAIKQERIETDEESVVGDLTDHPANQASPTSSTQAGVNAIKPFSS